MPRGIAKANAHYNNLQARDDWNWLAGYANRHGYSAEVVRYMPKPDAGYRAIDKCIDKLKAAMGIECSVYEMQQASERVMR